MVSKETFDDLFLPGIRQECRHAEASLYHLDGPNALTHLDSLLEIPELDAIQWDSLEQELAASSDYQIVPSYNKLNELYNSAKRG